MHKASKSTNTKKQEPDVTSLLMALGSFHPLDKEAITFLKKHLVPLYVRKKKLLLKAGSICRNVYFIKKGAARGFIREGSRDITTWITIENELITSISSLDVQLPSNEYIQVIENSELFALQYDDLEKLYARSPDFNISIRKLLQRYYGDAERRAFIARLTNAENKYQHFLHRHHDLVNRIPLKYIASFLGISLETLSRVRKKMSTTAIK